MNLLLHSFRSGAQCGQRSLKGCNQGDISGVLCKATIKQLARAAFLSGGWDREGSTYKLRLSAEFISLSLHNSCWLSVSQGQQWRVFDCRVGWLARESLVLYIKNMIMDVTSCHLCHILLVEREDWKCDSIGITLVWDCHSEKQDIYIAHSFTLQIIS